MTRWRSEVQVLYGARKSAKTKQGNGLKKFSSVDDFISQAPQEAQPKLRELRRRILSILPHAHEKIWYGVPFYHECGEVVGFSVAKHHISLGLGAGVLPAERRKKLEEMGYRTGQCTVQIRFDQKIPAAFLRKMLTEKVRLNRSKR
ncbi:MAG: DUF1801 domain-containing protein [Verrucomicrobia bacterium]|nr:DUF1801 domain-containing protein [Verrucomicrobiota bacterium]NBR46695.1 DUF1801 domain-containing protein [Verrucomicrobiota bacterium]